MSTKAADFLEFKAGQDHERIADRQSESRKSLGSFSELAIRWRTSGVAPRNDPGDTTRQRLASRLFENTNRGLLYAREIMAGLGLQTANVVSSPCHMRRTLCAPHFSGFARLAAP